MNLQPERMDEVISRLERIEAAVAQLLQQRTVKEMGLSDGCYYR